MSSAHLFYQVMDLLQVALNAGSVQCSFTLLIPTVPLHVFTYEHVKDKYQEETVKAL